MRRYVIVATAMRGRVEPPELLSAADQWEANIAAESLDRGELEPLCGLTKWGPDLQRVELRAGWSLGGRRRTA